MLFCILNGVLQNDQARSEIDQLMDMAGPIDGALSRTPSLMKVVVCVSCILNVIHVNLISGLCHVSICASDVC